MGVFSENAIIGASAAGGYDIEQSLRFKDGSSGGKLTFTPSSTASSNKKYTYSFWFKGKADMAGLNANKDFDFITAVSTDWDSCSLGRSSGKLAWYHQGGTGGYLVTTQEFRDPASWYHCVLRYDSTDSTAGDRMRMFINGEEVTAFSTDTNPALNYSILNLNQSGVLQEVNRSQDGSYPASCYMAEVHMIDGQALTPASFGETNSATNQWVPIEVTGMTYGTNGFYQKYSATELANSFTDSAEGHDVAANGNVHTDTSVKKIGTASAQFDGTGDYLSIPASSDWDFGTGDFTIEFWVNYGAVQSGNGILSCTTASGNDRWNFSHGASNDLYFQVYSGGSSVYSTQIAAGIGTGTWRHIAVVKDSGNITAYVDGTSYVGPTAAGTFPALTTTQLDVGRHTSSYYLNGYLDEIRISNTARYNSNFTAPTTEFTNDANTMLLLHCDGSDSGTTFTDSSTRPRNTITANGDVANTRAQYKVGDSSIKFDGTGDYLEMPDSGDWDFGSSSWTVEGWFYVSSWTDSSFIWNHWQDDNNFLGIRVLTGGDLNILTKASSSVVHNIDFTSVDLPTSTWVHLAVVRDTSAGNFVIYKDGTSVGSTANAVAMPDVAGTARINGGRVYGNYWTGYLDEFRVSNSARYTGTFTPSTTAFTADANTLLLIHSDFNGGLGADSSGNQNDFNITNITVSDQVLDSPTNNFCTWNPIAYYPGITTGTLAGNTYSEGNLKVASTVGSGANWTPAIGTLSVSSGKWYWEYNFISNTGNSTAIVGVMNAFTSVYANPPTTTGYRASNGNKYIDWVVTSYGATLAAGDIIGCALDLDAETITFYKNNVSQGAISLGAQTKASGSFTPTIAMGDTSVWTANFGQDSSFAGAETAQGNGGDGEDFYYTPPTGFKALCTDNLSDPSIADPTKHFNTVLYTGTGASHTISSLDFAPDLTWHKSRSYGSSNALFDSVRGGNNVLSSNGNGTEVTYSDMITAFSSNGFTMGADASQAWINQSSYTYASWNWKAGGTASSNGDGSITSSVSANPTAGFSIGTYTGNGTAGATVGHGLSQAPELIIVKCYDGLTFNWTVGWGAGGAAWTDYMHLDTTAAAVDDLDFWRDTYPTSSVFTIGSNGNVNYNNDDFVFYAFHSVDGYSKVGSYTGNNNADGPFIYTGFRPAWVMVKSYSAGGTHYDWPIYDSARSTYNAVGNVLEANQNQAEITGTGRGLPIDFLSNGFKHRSSYGENNSTASYIYLAFAESPFKTANAR